MTNDQINAAIAEACGRRRNPNGGWYPDNGLKVGAQGIANYCADLNAMHEAIIGLPKELKSNYLGYLFEVVNVKKVGEIFNAHNATARQRAEAFLRALGKWEEAK